MNPSLLRIQQLAAITLLLGCADRSTQDSAAKLAEHKLPDAGQAQLAEQPDASKRPMYAVYTGRDMYTGRDKAESKWPYIKQVHHNVDWIANRVRAPQWIVQSSDYVRNEVPPEFLRKCYSNQFDNAALHRFIKLNLGSGQQTSKFLLCLRSLGTDVYGYSIYTADQYSEPIEMGRFENATDESFLWINASGVDSGILVEEKIPIGSGRHTTYTEEWRRYDTKIPGADVDVIALDAGSRAFVDKATSILLDADATLPVVLGGESMMHFAKFCIANGGAPRGKLRFLSWEELNSAKH